MTSVPSYPPNIIFTEPPRTEYVTQTVHEHRAPTDASVALLKEMEEKAAAKITEAVRLEGNGFNCVVHTEWDALSDQTLVAVIFDLNGKRQRVDHAFRRGTDVLRDVDAMAVVHTKVAERIASVMLTGAFSELARNKPRPMR